MNLSNTSRFRASGGAPNLKGSPVGGGAIVDSWGAGGGLDSTSSEGSEAWSLPLTMAVLEISVGFPVKSDRDTPCSGPSRVFPPHAEPAQGPHLETWAWLLHPQTRPPPPPRTSCSRPLVAGTHQRVSTSGPLQLPLPTVFFPQVCSRSHVTSAGKPSRGTQLK